MWHKDWTLLEPPTWTLLLKPFIYKTPLEGLEGSARPPAVCSIETNLKGCNPIGGCILPTHLYGLSVFPQKPNGPTSGKKGDLCMWNLTCTTFLTCLQQCEWRLQQAHDGNIHITFLYTWHRCWSLHMGGSGYRLGIHACCTCILPMTVVCCICVCACIRACCSCMI